MAFFKFVSENGKMCHFLCIKSWSLIILFEYCTTKKAFISNWNIFEGYFLTRDKVIFFVAIIINDQDLTNKIDYIKFCHLLRNNSNNKKMPPKYYFFYKLKIFSRSRFLVCIKQKKLYRLY